MILETEVGVAKLSLTIPLMGLLLAAPLAGQESVPSRAVIEIGEVVSLRVAPGEGGGGAMRLDILSNRPWRLLVVDGSGEDLVVPYPGPDVPGIEVARGGPGRLTLEADPEWLDRRAQGLPGTGSVRFTLTAD